MIKEKKNVHKKSMMRMRIVAYDETERKLVERRKQKKTDRKAERRKGIKRKE